MHQETELIVNAIESLRPAESFFRDYIFPIASAFFISIFGAGIAFMAVRRQENIQIEKDKMDAANRWTLRAEGARSSLIGIKQNYHGKLTEDPIRRMAAVPTIWFQAFNISEDFEDLSFVVGKRIPETEVAQKWSQISRIRAMIVNYNQLLMLWKKRNELYKPIGEKLLKNFTDKAFVNVSVQEVINCIGPKDLAVAIQHTETVIKLTDDIIAELDDFLENFPHYATSLIATKRLKKYGSVLTYSHGDNPLLIDIIQPSPKVDYSSVEELFGQSTVELHASHRSGYEPPPDSNQPQD